MKRIIRLTEGDLRRIVKRSANRILREGMFDNPLNKTDLDGSEIEDEDGSTPEVGTPEYDPDIDDLGMNGPDDNIEGFKSPFYGLRGYNDDDEEFLRNAEYDANEYDDDYGYDEPMELPESRRRMSRIIKESIRKVLREAGGMDFQSANNRLETVPEDVAKNYGFRPEYRMEDGTNVWGKYLKPGESGDMLLSRLGIRKWATYDVKGHVRIYVEPEYAEPNQGPWGNRRRKIGDYVDTEWADKDGAIFHNPNNGHFKRF
jgi:hypothetical protein